MILHEPQKECFVDNVQLLEGGPIVGSRSRDVVANVEQYCEGQHPMGLARCTFHKVCHFVYETGIKVNIWNPMLDFNQLFSLTLNF